MRFMLYDQVLSVEHGRRIVAQKTVTLDGEYLTGHYQKRPIMPATLVIEAIAQAAGWLNFVTHEQSIRMVVALVENVSFKRSILCGETMTVEVNVLFLHPGGLTVKGEARVGDEVVATVERMVFANQTIARSQMSEHEFAHYDYLQVGARIPDGSKR